MIRFLAAFVALTASGVWLGVGTERGSAAVQRCGGASMYDVRVPGAPFSAVATPDEQHVFVSINFSNPREQNGIAVLECTAGRYRFVRLMPLENQPTGLSLSDDGALLVAPDDNFIAFLDPKRILSRVGDPILGFFEDVVGDDGSAVYSNITSDGRFAFVAEEQSRSITVVDLQKARQTHYDRASIVGEIPVGRAPVALVFSRDGTHLFTTSQISPESYGFAKTCKSEGVAAGNAKEESPGAILVIDVAKAESDPPHAVIGHVSAGCHPVRATLSPDGETLWVSARASNAALAFSAAKLVAADAQAKIVEVGVGAAPVPIIVTPDGRYVLVGNSNRFGEGPRGNQTVSVIDAAIHTVVGEITVGRFPREFSRTRSGSTVFLSNYDSHTITVLDPSAISRIMRKPEPRQ
jgi:YVTN family beta-propeller protein